MRRTKLNAQDDRQFYQQPRIVKHVDDQFLSQVGALTYLASCILMHAASVLMHRFREMKRPRAVTLPVVLHRYAQASMLHALMFVGKEYTQYRCAPRQ